MQRNFVFLSIFLFSNVTADVLPLTQRYFHQEDQGHSYTRGTYMIILSDASLETYLTESNTGNFVEFKKTQGYNVVIQDFNDVGGDENTLKSYLQEYYENEDSMLEYVLLVGDVDGSYDIPSFYIGSYNENEDDVTDYPYTFSNDDVLDTKFFIGRWSIRQIQDLLQLKIRSMQYIKMDNLSDYSHLDKGLVVGGNYNGEDDAPNSWPVTPVWTSLWLQDEWYNYGYSEVDTAFFHAQNQNTENAQIASSWNSGVGVINYRGWGDANGWHKPYFHRENIDLLTNGWKLPIVMSFVCNTGDFGNNIDQCYGEYMLNAGSFENPKGAAAMIGPSDLDTDTRFNNVMCGVMWDELLEGRIPELGPALHAGKKAIEIEFPGYAVNGQNISEFYHHVYGVLGDPSLPVWLQEPKNLSADIEQNFSLSRSYLSTVITDDSGNSIMDVVGALIYNGELEGKGLSNQDGILDIDFENISEGETLYLYLNKPQFFQKQIELTFTSDDGSEFTPSDYEIPTSQPEITYNYFDSESENENAPVYNWVEISDVGNNLGLTDDSHITNVEIGFDFQYYGEVFNSITICSNGWVSFLPCLDGDNNGNCNSLSHFFNNSITHPIGPYAMLAPFYDDLDDNVGTEAFNIFSYQDTENHRFIVQWDQLANGQHDEDCEPFPNALLTPSDNSLIEIWSLEDSTEFSWVQSPDPESCRKETFQLILLDSEFYPTTSGDSEIIFQYKEIYDVDDHGITIGIESPDKNDGIQYHFSMTDGPFELEDNFAIKFTTEYEGNEGRIVQPRIQSTNDYSITYKLIRTIFVEEPELVISSDTLDVGINNSLFVLHRDLYINYIDTLQALGDSIIVYRWSILSSDSTELPSSDTYNVKFKISENTLSVRANSNPLNNFKLYSNYPNPFNPSTSIQYYLPNRTEIQLTIFDHLGKEVNQLEHKSQEPGFHHINWDGRNQNGTVVSSGIYLYQITYDGTTQTGKMLLVK